MDQTSGLEETVAVLALDRRQQLAGGGEEAEQVPLRGGETPPLPHQRSDCSLPLPHALRGTLPPGLQLRELQNKCRPWENRGLGNQDMNR